MSFGLAAGRRLFHPSRHLWLRATKEATENVSNYPWIVEIGLSQRRLADIGDVTSMAPARENKEGGSWYAQTGDSVVAIDWDAQSITSADELYHTVWQTYSEQTIIRAPISGIVDIVMKFDPILELDEDTVVALMRTDDDTLKKTAEGMMEEDEYNDFVTTIPPGKFGD